MAQRLSAAEVSLLALDTAHHPGQVGTVDILDPPAGGEFDYQQLITLIRHRIAQVPRYRMRVRNVPAGLGSPVWVEDEGFDLTYHVRQSALPRPGTMGQLREFVGRVLARRLDRNRPLWETYLVEGLAGGRLALVTKSHEALVDGIDTVDIGQVLLDRDPEAPLGTAQVWEPLPEPSPLDLLAGAAWEMVSDPAQTLQRARIGATGLLGLAITVGETVGGLGRELSELAGNALHGGRPPTDSPLAGSVSQQRRFATLALPLDEFKRIRSGVGESERTVNDVILAVIAGGLRAWLLTRGGTGSVLTALAPMSVLDDDGEPSALGSQVAPHLVQLPVGEPNPLMRLHQVAYGNRAHAVSGRAVDARTITDLAGFAPTTLHALGVRVAQETVRGPHDLVITNVPGPQSPRYAGSARLVASYPVLPLGPGHLLAIGVTSYDGEVFFGLTGDRDAVTDLDVLAPCLRESLEELTLATVRPPTARRAARRTAGAARPEPSGAAKKASPATKKASPATKKASAATKKTSAATKKTSSAANKAGSATKQASPATKTEAPKKAAPGKAPGGTGQGSGS